MNKHQFFVDEAKPRAVQLSGEVTRARVCTIINQLKRLQTTSALEPVKLIINSSGGNLYETLTLCGALESIFVVPVHAVVIGECSSVATLVLLSCTTRSCLPHARFGIHSGITSRQRFRDRMSPKRLQELLVHTGLISGTLVTTYERKLGLSMNSARELIEKGNDEHMLSAMDAKRIGLVSRIEYNKVNIYPAALKATVL